jgi:hypothetical protein
MWQVITGMRCGLTVGSKVIDEAPWGGRQWGEGDRKNSS